MVYDQGTEKCPWIAQAHSHPFPTRAPQLLCCGLWRMMECGCTLQSAKSIWIKQIRVARDGDCLKSLSNKSFYERPASFPNPYIALALKVLGQTRKTFKCSNKPSNEAPLPFKITYPILGSLDGQKAPTPCSMFHPLVPILSLNIDGVRQNLGCLRPVLAEKLVINKIYGRQAQGKINTHMKVTNRNLMRVIHHFKQSAIGP